MTKNCPNCRNACFHRAATCEMCRYSFLDEKLPPLRDDRLKSPYPFFGTKKKVASDLWRLFGDAKRYVEPFMGSGALLLARPQDRRVRCVVSDSNRFISNFWRAVQYQPEEVAKWCDWPVNECDLHARHTWLEAQPFEEAIAGTPDGDEILNRIRKLEAGLQQDPSWFDAKIAGWWAWGQSCWFGDGWCNGKPVRRKPECGVGRGVEGKRPETDCFKGVQIRRPHIGRRIGVHRTHRQGLEDYLRHLKAELREVIVCCGDWTRVVTPCVLDDDRKPCAIFLDPPYKEFGKCYGRYHDDQISARVRAWAVENGENRRLRIALCGFDGEHQMPGDWSVYRWDHNKGLSHQKRNAGRERIWCSPTITPLDRLEALVRVE